MRVAVVGGGISGLAAAHRLTERAAERGEELELVLLEGSNRLGGVIRTEHRDGCILEWGPESMITDKPWALALARRLGLDRLLIGTQAQNRRSFVVHQGKLQPVPEGFQILAPAKFVPLALSPIFSPAGKLRMALDLIIPRRRRNDDESLGDFVTRRLGREALDRMAQPMIAGIYGADPMRLSLQATIPRFLDMEREYGSVIRGMWARSRAQAASAPAGGASPTNGNGVSGARYGLFVSFQDGMGVLIERLAERLPAGATRLNTRVERLTPNAQGWRLHLGSGELLEADAVILALPTYAAAELLRPLDDVLARMLGEIPYAASATVNLAYREQDVPHPLDGFGFVVPSTERLNILGCTFTHRKWAGRAPEGTALLRAFLGEAVMHGRTDAELVELVRADLRKLLGITRPPGFTITARHPRSMAQYAVGHLERVDAMERRAAALPGIHLAGNGYRGIGIPDCVHLAELAAERVIGTGM